MKGSRAFALLAYAALALSAAGFAAAAEKPEPPPPPRSEKPSTVSAADSSTPVYKPPLRGAPGGRVGGGTRGTGRSVFVLSVLAPDHTGLTMNEQPALYWYISSPATSPVEVTVVDPRAAKPLMQTRISPPVPAGVHSIRLASENVRLEEGVAYRWYVSVVPDANRRSKDLLAGATIERVMPADGLRAQLTQAGSAEMPSLLAQAGLWYDAIASITALIDASPGDATLRRQRAALLAQVGLPDVGE